MRLPPLLSVETHQRRWLLHLLSLLLGFTLLAAGIWLYYDYKVRQIEQQHHLLQPQR